MSVCLQVCAKCAEQASDETMQRCLLILLNLGINMQTLLTHSFLERGYLNTSTSSIELSEEFGPSRSVAANAIVSLLDATLIRNIQPSFTPMIWSCEFVLNAAFPAYLLALQHNPTIQKVVTNQLLVLAPGCSSRSLKPLNQLQFGRRASSPPGSIVAPQSYV